MPRCQKCGGELSFIPEYDRWYCHDCSSYAPKDLPPPEIRACPTCGIPLDYIEEYDRWYCHRCETYAPEEEADEARMCPVCRGELEYIPEYERWYCDDCQEYAPREERFCPTCDGPLAYLKEYERWYCYSCKSYPPREEEAVPGPVGEVLAEEEAEVPEEAAPADGEPPEEEVPPEESPPEDELPPIDVGALDGLLKADLVELAEAHGLATDGTKAVLKGRLVEHAEALAAEAAEAPPEEVEAPEEVEEEVPPEEEAPPEEVEEEAPPEEVKAPEEIPAAAPVEERPAVAAPLAAARPKVKKAKPVRVKKVRLEAKCPTCAGGLDYIEDYGRHYCYSCGNYAPKDLTAKLLAAPAVPKERVRAEAKTCPTCRNPLSYIQAYDEWYCHTCERYPEKEAAPPKAAEAVENPCPTCGAELEHIPEYGRDYCYSCGNYAPKAEAAVKAVAKEAVPAAKEAVEAPPAMAAGPARPTLAFAALIQFVIAFVLFITSSLITLLVWGGVLGDFFLYQGGGFVITAYGPLSGILMTSGTPVPVNSFNILLFIAILFAGIGFIALVLSFLPKRK